MMMDTEEITVLEMVEDLQTPCDYHPFKFCGKAEAEWIAFASCGSCGLRVHRLIGTDCKDFILATESGMLCPECMEPTVPARHIFTRFELL